MFRSRRAACLLIASLVAGCGGDDTVQLKPGGPITEQEKAEIRSHDEIVEAAERGNTPTAASLKKR